MKKCSKCFITKPISDFAKHKNNRDGLQFWCKNCYKISSKKYRDDNPEKRKKTQKNYRDANPEKVKKTNETYRKANLDKARLREHLRRIKKQNNGIYLVSDKFLKKIYDSPCVFCGSKERIELDHIIPIARGGQHSEGNLQPLCKSCNSSKSDKTMTEWYKMKRQTGGS